MYIRIVHHCCKPGQVEAGRAYIDHVGATISSAPGLIFRYRMENPQERDVLTTLAAWRDKDAFDAFQKTRMPSDHSDPSNPFERTAQQFYEVTAVMEISGSQ